MKKKITFIHITGAPIQGKEFGFTEGGLPHALFTAVNLINDYDITIVCPNLPGNRQKQIINYKGVRILCLGSSRWVKWSRIGGLSFLKDTYRYISEENPDILIANNLLMSFLLTLMPKRATRIGIIHHLYYTQNIKGSKFVVRGIGILEKLAVNHIKLNGIGVVNPSTKSFLVKEGCPGDRVVIVGNGVNPNVYPFSKNKVPHSLIYIGRLAELKEVASLVDVISIIKKKIPDILLHIVGDGPKSDEVKARCKQLKVSNNVIIHGYLTENEKINLLKKSAIYVSNSQFEGFGIPLVEAMSTGTVPVVSDIYAHRFVFQGEDVGYLVHNKEEMATKVIDLLINETKRLHLANNSRKLVEKKWTWKGVSQKYKELISKSVNSTRNEKGYDPCWKKH